VAILICLSLAGRTGLGAATARGEERVKFIADRDVKICRPSAAETNELRQIEQSSCMTCLKGKIGCEWIDAALKDATRADKEARPERISA